MITGSGIRFRYDRVAVLDGVDVTATQGETVGLIGPNGSGKTTLLRSLYGSLRPQGGEIRLDDKPLPAWEPRAVAREIAVVVQESAGDLPFTVTELVMLGRQPHLRSFQRWGVFDHRLVEDALTKVGAVHLAGRVFSGLSGGEKQRVLIARALTQQPSHLLLDEPTNHLDIRYQHEILRLVHDLDLTSIVVLHDLNLAARFCDRLVLLDAGKVVAVGSPDDVLLPQVLEPVYRIGVERIDHRGVPQLVFHSLADGTDSGAG